MKRITRFTLIWCVAVCATVLTACTTDSPPRKTTEAPKVAAPIDVSAELQNTDSLLSILPENTYGALLFNLHRTAYRRLLASPWGELLQSSSFMHLIPGGKRVIAAFRAAGLQLNSESATRAFFGEGIGFLAPAPTSEKVPALTFVFRPERGGGYPPVTTLPDIRKGLEEQGLTTRDVELSFGSGFSISSSDIRERPRRTSRRRARKKPQNDDSQSEWMVAWNNELVVISTHIWPIERVLDSERRAVPSFVRSEGFREIVRDFPQEKHRLALGYLNLAAFQAGGMPQEHKETFNAFPSDDSLTAVALSVSMQTTPALQIHAIRNEHARDLAHWPHLLQSAAAPQLDGMVTGRPPVMFSMSGRTLFQLARMYTRTSNDTALAPYVSELVPLLRDIDKINASFRFIRDERALFAAPILTLGMATPEPALITAALKRTLGPLATQASVGTNGWQTKSIAGQPVSYIRSQLGPGLYIAETAAAVHLSSSESNLRDVLQRDPQKAFTSTLLPATRAAMTDTDAVAAVYLDLRGLANIVRQVDTLVPLYVTKREQVEVITSERTRARLESLGALVSTLEQNEHSLRFAVFFDPPRG